MLYGGKFTVFFDGSKLSGITFETNKTYLISSIYSTSQRYLRHYFPHQQPHQMDWGLHQVYTYGKSVALIHVTYSSADMQLLTWWES